MTEKTEQLTVGGYVVALDRISRNVCSLRDEQLSPFGITWLEYEILAYLKSVGGVARMTDVARAVGRAATSFTPIADKLQHKDMTERRGNESDRRSVKYAITPKGLEILDSAPPVSSLSIFTKLDKLSTKKVTEALKLLMFAE